MNEHMDQNINGKFPITRLRVGLFQIGLILAILYVISRYDYLLFHSLTEFIGAAIALGIFMLTWNSRKFFTNNFYLFIGVAFLASGIISVFHALSYRGMGVISGTSTSADLATQLWMANQYVLAITFVSAPFFLKRKLNARIIFLGYATALIFIFLSIFYWKIFPVAYQEDLGLTPFKKISEYVAVFFFLIALYFFYRKRILVEQRVLRLMSVVLILLALSTWLFTIYIGVYDFFNMLGHLVRILAFYGSYLAIVELGLMRPYQSIFRELNKNRLALKSEKDEWKKTFNSVPDLIAILNKEHRIIRVNKAMASRLNTTSNKCIGLNCYECVHGADKPIKNCPHSLTISDGKEHVAEVEEARLGGTFLVSTTPIFDKNGKVMGSVHVARDITERKKMEKAKDEFISLASHQLRTPLANIRLSSELMLRGLAGQNSPEQTGFLEEINKATKKMGILIGNLLNVSRIEMGNFDIREEAMDISSVAESIAQDLKPLMIEKEINYNISVANDLPVLYFDENVLHIIIENLLSNSLRYTPKGGFINFQIKKQNDQIIIEVSDTGCGIPFDQREKIFKKSFRSDMAKSITSEGVGLGLYMVKSVCDKIEAKIWFESESGKGTTFFVSLPVKKDS